MVERDAVDPGVPSEKAFEVPRNGIPHFFQPHAFLPRGRQVLTAIAPDVLAALLEAGAEAQDLRSNLRGAPEPGDEDLVYLWVRRPLIEWALRRAAAGEPGVELREGAEVTGVLASDDGRRALGVSVADGEPVRGDVVVDALGRYRCPSGWARAAGTPTDSGAVYYCRYFELRDGVEHLDAGPLNPLNPRGDLGYMGFNTFRGDNRTYAVILLAPSTDRELRALRHEQAWMTACRAMKPLDVMQTMQIGPEPISCLVSIVETLEERYVTISASYGGYLTIICALLAEGRDFSEWAYRDRLPTRDLERRERGELCYCILI